MKDLQRLWLLTFPENVRCLAALSHPVLGLIQRSMQIRNFDPSLTFVIYTHYESERIEVSGSVNQLRNQNLLKKKLSRHPCISLMTFKHFFLMFYATLVTLYTHFSITPQLFPLFAAATEKYPMFIGMGGKSDDLPWSRARTESSIARSEHCYMMQKTTAQLPLNSNTTWQWLFYWRLWQRKEWWGKLGRWV